MAKTGKKVAANSKQKTAEQPAANSQTDSAPSQEQIAQLAYMFWEENGRHEGEEEANWLRAERELRGLGPQQPAR